MCAFEGYTRGMGIGGWLTNYKRFNVLSPERWSILTVGDMEHFETYITEKDIERIAGYGLDHVRLGFDQIVLEESPNHYRESTFAIIDRFVGWCEKYGLKIVFNLHKAVGNYCDIKESVELLDDAGLQERFIALWCEFARRYASKPGIAFELLNELRDVDPDKWNSLWLRTLAALRKYDAERVIVIGGTRWNSCNTVELLTPVDDPNVVFTWHFYAPLEFTHQRSVLHPDPLFYNRSMPYPTDDVARYNAYLELLGSKERYTSPAIDKDLLRKLTANVFRYQAEHPERVIWCGEFGTIRHADIKWRENWMRDVISLNREHNMPYCVWNYLSTPNDGNRFSLVDDDTREILSDEMLRIIRGESLS